MTNSRQPTGGQQATYPVLHGGHPPLVSILCQPLVLGHLLGVPRQGISSRAVPGGGQLCVCPGLVDVVLRLSANCMVQLPVVGEWWRRPDEMS
jgi:hypothetical protein